MSARLASLLSFVALSLMACPALAAPDVTEAFTRPSDDAPLAPVAPLPDVELEPEPEAPPRRTPRPRVRFDTVYGGASLGTGAGALLGAAVGLSIAGAIGCDERGQGWMSGYTCTSGFFYLGTIGALIAMPIGTMIGAALTLAIEGAPLDGLGDGLLGLLLGVLPALGAVLGYLLTGQLSGPLVYAMGILANLPPLTLAVWTHDHLEVQGFAVAPSVTPLADGAVIGFGGRF